MLRNLLAGVCVLGLVGIGGAEGPPMPRPSPKIVLPVGVGVAATFTWVYPEDVADLAGFHLVRCGPTSGDDCVPEVPLGGLFAPSSRTGTDPSGQAGQHYCWAITAVLTSGATSKVSSVACHTLAGVAVGIPLPAGQTKKP
jgi:hypothetical protein